MSLRRLAALVLSLALVGCGPMLNGHSGGGQQRCFWVTVHNDTPSSWTFGYWIPGMTALHPAPSPTAAGGVVAFVFPIGGTPDQVFLRTPSYDVVLREGHDYPQGALMLDYHAVP